MTSLAEQLYQRPLNLLVPSAGIYAPGLMKLGALRTELSKWQQMAAHESPRTTKLYDRTNDEISLDEIERVVI